MAAEALVGEHWRSAIIRILLSRLKIALIDTEGTDAENVVQIALMVRRFRVKESAYLLLRNVGRHTLRNSIIANPPVTGAEAKLVLQLCTCLSRNDLFKRVISRCIERGTHLLGLPCRIGECACHKDRRLRTSLPVGNDDLTLTHVVRCRIIRYELVDGKCVIVNALREGVVEEPQGPELERKACSGWEEGEDAEWARRPGSSGYYPLFHKHEEVSTMSTNQSSTECYATMRPPNADELVLEPVSQASAVVNEELQDAWAWFGGGVLLYLLTVESTEGKLLDAGSCRAGVVEYENSSGKLELGIDRRRGVLHLVVVANPPSNSREREENGTGVGRVYKGSIMM